MSNDKFQSLYPRLVVSDAATAIDFYTAAFDAREIERYVDGDGRIVHAAVEIGGARLAVKDGDGVDRPPAAGERTPVILALKVADADTVGAAIMAAGGSVIFEIQDAGHGERAGRFADPFGHQWMISQQIEELSPKEIQRRLD